MGRDGEGMKGWGFMKYGSYGEFDDFSSFHEDGE